MRLALLIGLLATFSGSAHAQTLIQSLDAFKKVPLPAGVECNDAEGPTRRECQFKHTSNGKTYALVVSFVMGENGTGFLLAATPTGAHEVQALSPSYSFYANLFPISNTASVATLAPTLSALMELCAKRSHPRPDGSCEAAQRESTGEMVVSVVPGDSGRSGVGIFRRWMP